MQNGDALKIRHQALAARFSDLAAGRDQAPVFAIEHGLDEIALAEIRTDVSLQLELDPQLQGPSWSWSYLPLLVLATEVGYRYRGTGTDFWPILSRELGTEASPGFRTGIAYFFEDGHQRFGLARPGSSAWERHFPYIAWPVGNALMPLELQPQLTDALRRAVRAGVSPGDPEALLYHLRMLAAGHASRRFEQWLANAGTALEVMRRLLSPGTDGWLSPGILRRIDADIRKDPGASRAISEARAASARRANRSTRIPPARFVFSLDNDRAVQLRIRGPVLPSDIREEAIAALKFRGDRITAAGAAHSVPLRFFLAGGELPLEALSPLPENPLRRPEAGSCAEPAGTVLERMQPQPADFFLAEPGHRTARAIDPDELLPRDAIVLQLLASDTDSIPVFRRLQAFCEPDAIFLQKQGFSIAEHQPALRILGLPLPGSQTCFAAGLPVLAAHKKTDRRLLMDECEPAQGSVRLGRTDWALFFPPAGEHTLGPADADNDELFKLSIIDAPDVEPASITVLPEEATVADLENGRLEIRITAPLALENITVRLRLLAGSRTLATADSTLARLPARIAGRSPLLQSLKSGLAGTLAAASGIRLQVEAGGLLPATVSLPPLRQDLVYDAASRQWLSETEPERTFSLLTATPSAPLPHQACSSPSDIRLLLPDAPDHDALPAGIIRSESRSFRPGPLQENTAVLPSLIREAHSYNGRTGLTDIVRASLAWQLARADDPISDWRRRSVADQLDKAVTELLCGGTWSRLESGLDQSILSQHGALLFCAKSCGLVTGEDLPHIASPSDRTFLRNRLIVRLREVVTDIRDVLAGWDESRAGDLDLAVIEAYEDLRSHLLDAGREAFDEVDMVRSARDWQQALERALGLPLLPMFRRLILPNERWNTLVSQQYEDLSEDDIVDLLTDCHVDTSRRPGMRWIDRSELRTLLQLWVTPRSMLDTDDWPQLLSRALSDMQTTRAVRYATLRYRLVRQEMQEAGAL